MGISRGLHPRDRTAAAGVSALCRCAHRAQRSVVDLAHRGTLERPAPTLRFARHRASAFPTLAGARRAAPHGRGTGRTSASAWQAGFARMLCRRHVCPGKKRGACVGKTKRGKGTKIMGVVDAHGAPLALCIESAAPAEVRLVEDTLEERFLRALPERLIGDKAYDSNQLDADLAGRGITMISPNRTGTRATQDKRVLRRYQRRWKVERFFAWLGNFRRLVVRYEWHAQNYLALLHLACFQILWKLL
jgi:transposase